VRARLEQSVVDPSPVPRRVRNFLTMRRSAHPPNTMALSSPTPEGADRGVGRTDWSQLTP
jgi:hypothetical protein